MRIKDIDGADEALKRLGEVQRELAGSDALLNDEIKGMKDELKEETADARDEVEELLTRLEAFATENPDIFPEGKRSLKLVHGKISFKSSAALEIPNPVRTISALLKAGHDEAVKVTEEVIKAVLAKWDDAELRKFGVHRIERENFKAVASDLRAARKAEGIR